MSKYLLLVSPSFSSAEGITYREWAPGAYVCLNKSWQSPFEHLIMFMIHFIPCAQRLMRIVHTNIVILFKVIIYLADQLIKI
jgi:hypothetical protein